MLLLQHGQGRASGAIRRLRVCSKPLIRMSSGCLSARLSGLHSGMVDALPARKPLPMQPPKYYPGVGCCIFCFRTDAPLTDEHVVPLAFAGNHVMRAASCKDCAAKTSFIERRVLREYWGKSREALNFPTRRPKRRSDKLTIHTEDDGEELTVEVDWNEFPAIFALPRFERPGRMRGVLPSREGKFLEPWIATCGRNKAVPNQVSEPLLIDDFVGFIAKIAHSFAFAQLGREALTFWRALPSIIDGSYPFPFYLIGGVGSEEPIASAAGETTFSTSFSLHTQVVDGLEYLTVGLQMFSDIGGPTYAAIFGARPSNTEEPTKFKCS
jgi:hypothetical protein